MLRAKRVVLFNPEKEALRYPGKSVFTRRLCLLSQRI